MRRITQHYWRKEPQEVNQVAETLSVIAIITGIVTLLAQLSARF